MHTQAGRRRRPTAARSTAGRTGCLYSTVERDVMHAKRREIVLILKTELTDNSVLFGGLVWFFLCGLFFPVQRRTRTEKKGKPQKKKTAGVGVVAKTIFLFGADCFCTNRSFLFFPLGFANE